MPRPRAVITGAGAVCAFGAGLRALHDGLAEGRAAVGPIRSFDASSFPTRVAGESPVAFGDARSLAAALAADGRAEELATRWEAAGLLRDRKVGFGLVAAAEAWLAAGCGEAERGATLCIALGLEQGFLQDFAPLYATGRLDWSAEPAADLPPTRFRSQVDTCARLLRELFGLRGPTVVHASACAAGGLAVAHAAALIERGEADIVLCGGADSMVNPLGVGGMTRLGAPSPRAEADACRPFDRRRDGLAIGEGAAIFVVEAEDRARARGARPIARVAGWGSTQDAHRATAPRPDGSKAAEAMRRALARAGRAPEEIGYVNAHGTGTPLNDPAEGRAIRAALGAHGSNVPVSSIKGAVGHLMAASGALELAASLLPFARGVLPGTAHHRELDPDCGELNVIGEAPRLASVEALISSSFGFGGQNVAVLLEAAR